jgi:hypothetical protein
MSAILNTTRVWIVTLLIAAVTVAGALAAHAASAGISPSVQGGTSPYNAQWSLQWGTTAPYEVLFLRGNGSGLYWPSTSSTSYNDTYTFYSCIDTSFNQRLEVIDGTNQWAVATARTNVLGGSFCFGG